MQGFKKRMLVFSVHVHVLVLVQARACVCVQVSELVKKIESASFGVCARIYSYTCFSCMRRSRHMIQLFSYLCTCMMHAYIETNARINTYTEINTCMHTYMQINYM